MIRPWACRVNHVRRQFTFILVITVLLLALAIAGQGGRPSGSILTRATPVEKDPNDQNRQPASFTIEPVTGNE
ncbi:MAG: hypothetical protein H7301_13900 [Cryobacterium sp.]|nr:hypothetical protein [Oligoflexia bacterium]